MGRAAGLVGGDAVTHRRLGRPPECMETLSTCVS